MGKTLAKRTIPLKTLRKAIKTIDNAIPRRGASGYCPICDSGPFDPCYEGCAVGEAKDLLWALRKVAKGEAPNA